MHFAVHPDSGFFAVSGPGSLAVTDQGATEICRKGPETVRRLTLDPAKKEEALAALDRDCHRRADAAGPARPRRPVRRGAMPTKR